MVAPIQSLMNMEYMLYGSNGYGLSAGAPSIANNYMVQSPYTSYANPYGYYANQYNPAFGQQLSDTYTSTTPKTAQDTVFAGLSNSEKMALVDDYAKSMEPSESFLGAAASGTAFAVLFHPRAILHPINTWKSFGMTKELFGDLANKGTELAKAWAKPELNEIVRNAYTAMNRIDARSLKGVAEKAGQTGFHMWRAPLEKGEYEQLKSIMQDAIKGLRADDPESVKKLVEATEKLNAANVKNGNFPKASNWVKNLFRGEKQAIPSAMSKAREEKVIAESVSKAWTAAGEGAGKTYLQTLKTSGGGLGGAAFFMGIEFLMGISKIKAAFGKDKETRWKQIGQTTVKGAGSAIGWAAGEALGTWGCAKLLAAAGTAIAPGIGTAIGAIAGMAVGSIGCWLAGKLTKKLVGQDVGDKVEAENMAKTQEGQVQLLQHTMEKMQKGEKVDPQAQMAVQKLIAQYSSAA